MITCLGGRILHSSRQVRVHHRLAIWTQSNLDEHRLFRDVVSDSTFCEPSSPGVTDPNFWTFRAYKKGKGFSLLICTSRVLNSQISSLDTVTLYPSTWEYAFWSFDTGDFLECYAPNVSLIPNHSSFTRPIESRRAHSLLISSNVILHCNESLSTDIQWTLSRCDDPRCSLALAFDRRVITNRSDILIPAKTLPYGLYRLNLTVSMIFSPDLNASALLYVKITPSGLTVNLVDRKSVV